eukprot:9195201-Pyramimonas_sp.AAC.1
MRDRANFGARLTFCGPTESSTEGAAVIACVTTPISAHPSSDSWPHRELRRRPQWQDSHA